MAVLSVYQAISPGVGQTYKGKDIKFCAGTFDFDSSYPTGGEDMDLRPYLAEVLVVLIEGKAGYSFTYDYATRKILAYRTGAINAPAEQVPDLTNLSAVTGVRFVAVGVM